MTVTKIERDPIGRHPSPQVFQSCMGRVPQATYGGCAHGSNLDNFSIQERADSNRRRFLFFFVKFNKYAATAASSSLLSAILVRSSCASADSKLYRVNHKKYDLLFLTITLANLNRFYSFCIIRISKKFYMQHITLIVCAPYFVN